MERREMLEQSFRSLAKSLPAMLGIGSGLAGLLKDKDEDAPVKRAGCFPARRDDTGANALPETDTKED